MRRLYVCLLLLFTVLPGLPGATARAAVPSVLQIAGLRTTANQGSFPAALFLPDGTLVLLWDQGDGIRVLHTDGALTTVLSELHLGAAGDHATELVPDGAGGVFLGGTSASGALTGTPGAAFSQPADTSLNPFVAHLDASLQLSFLSFLGTGRSSLASIGAGGGLVVMTGVCYSGALPVTPAALQRQPAASSAGTGYVEALSATTGALVYATYLSGVDGNTAPASVAVGSDGSAIVAGSTGSATFPTTNAIQPAIADTVSGFLSRLSPAGDRLLFSTYIAGAGLQSVALDSAREQIVSTGNLSFSQFPVAAATEPLASTPYQSLLRLSMDGTTLQDARVLLPGSASRVSTAADGTAWVTGQLSFPPTQQEIDAGIGDHYLLHLDLGGNVDAVARFGGSAANHSEAASLQTSSGAAAISPLGDHVVVPASITVATAPALASTQNFLLPLTPATGSVLPDAVSTLLPTDCTSGSCTSSGGLLLLFREPEMMPSYTLDTANPGLITLRNASPVPLQGLSVTGLAGQDSSNCNSSLLSAAVCSAALPASGGSLQISASGLPPVQVMSSVSGSAMGTPAPDHTELNFGLVSAASGTASLPLQLTNLSQAQQSVSMTGLNLPTGASYTLEADQGSCQIQGSGYALPAGQSCVTKINLHTSGAATATDALVQANWRMGGRDLSVTGFLQASAENISSTRIDFGPTSASGPSPLPRFLYVSNLATTALVHTPVQEPTGTPFSVEDGCPALLQPASLCQIVLLYQPGTARALDSITLDVDGTVVAVTGETDSASFAAGTGQEAALAATPQAMTFSQAVLAGTVSQEIQTVQLHNSSTAPVAMQLQVLGDFTPLNSCPSPLPQSATCSVALSFTPSLPGQRVGVLIVTDTTNHELARIALNGTGADLATITSNVDLGGTVAGEPIEAWYRVSSSSVPLSATMAGDGWTVALAPDFGGTSPTVSPGTFQGTASLQCSQCWVGVRFLPTVAGPSTATLKLSADAAGQPYDVHLQATATAANGLLLTPAMAELPATPIASSSAPVVLTLTNALSTPVNAALLAVTLDAGIQSPPDHDSFDCSSTLAPGEACAMRVSAAPSRQAITTPAVHVHTDQGDTTAAFSLTGTAATSLQASPTTLHFTAAGTGSIQLQNGGPQAVTIRSVTTVTGVFAVSSRCNALAPGQACSIAVIYSPGAQAATDLLTIVSTAGDLAGAPEVETTQVALSGVSAASAAVAAFPASLDFGPGSQGTSGAARIVRFRNQLPTPVSFTFFASHDFPLALTPVCNAVAPGDSCAVPVLFLPQAAGVLTGTLTAQASAADGSLLGSSAVTLRGYASGSGALLASSGATPDSPADFGSVVSGQTQQRSILLKNSGPAPVSIGGLTIASPFRLQSSTCGGAISSDTQCILTIEYAPSLLLDTNQEASQAPRQDRATLLVENTSAAELIPIYLQGSVTPAAASSNDVSLPTLVVDRSALTFLATGQQQAPSQQITLTNTGTTQVAVQQVAVVGGFSAESTCTSLAAGQSCSIPVHFVPAATVTGVQTGEILITYTAARALERITLLGAVSSGTVQTDLTALAFGDVPVGTTAQATFTIANPGPLPLPATFAISGSMYTLSGGTCPPNGFLAAGQTCTIQITFAPTATGLQGGNLVFNGNQTAVMQIPLSGTGVGGHLAISTTLIDFGSVLVGSSATLSLHLQNTGLASLPLEAPSLQGAQAAKFQVDPCGTATLSPGTGCDLTLHFMPAQVGATQATLLLGGAADQQPTTVTLKGLGADPPGIVLTVNGESSSSQTTIGGTGASFPLVVMAHGGYTGPVTLTCTAVQPAPNSACTLAPSTMSMQSGQASGTATITTSSWFLTGALPFTVLLFGRRKRRHAVSLLAIGALSTLLLLFAGCSDRPVGAPYTPSGSYQYRVDAVATGNPALHSSVLLNLSVQ